MRLPLFLLLFAIGGLLLSSARSAPTEIRSPDGNIAFALSTDAGGRLSYEVKMRDRAVIEGSGLGVSVGGDDLGAGAAIGKATRREINESYPVRGAHAKAVNHCHEAAIAIIGGKAKTPWMLEARVFNDGAAYRYRVPGKGKRHLDGEASQWKLPPGVTAFYQDDSRPDYETPWRTARVGEIKVKEGAALSAPVTFKLADGGFAMITEANLVGYSDMTLEPLAEGIFHAAFRNDPQGWEHDGDIVSPWRVTVVAPDLTALVNTDLLQNLCPPAAPELSKAAWIQPGRSTWQWMVTRHPKLPDQHQWIDWTRQLGFEYYLIDDGWNRWKADGKDAWECLRETIAYATAQKVKVWVWLHSKDIPDAAARQAWFAKASGMGVVGVKVDFPKPANAEWVQWYENILRDAAQARLMVDFHGAIKPTGRERTWPNELTREAVRGMEARKPDILSETILPFTRGVQGPMDFTPTDFRADYLVGRSWARTLAQAVVYPSPLLCYSGSPDDYLKSEALELIKAIPPMWDETVVLPGSEIGQVAAFARRKGPEWFIAIVNGSEARKMEISLGFLGDGTYTIEKFADTPDRSDAWVRAKEPANRTNVLTVDLRAAGGFIARGTKSATK